MATMYSLFLGVLFTAVCSDNGDGSGVLSPEVVITRYVMSLCPDLSGTVVETSKDFIGTNFTNSLFSLKPRGAHLYSLMNKDANKSRLGQYDAKYFLTGLNISEPLDFASLHRYVFNDHQKIFLTLYGPRSLEDQKSGTRTVSQPRPFYSASAISTPLQSGIMLLYPVISLCPDLSGTVVERSKDFIGVNCKCIDTSTTRSRLSTPFHSARLPVPNLLRGDGRNKAEIGKYTNVRTLIIKIASAELGTHEATGKNDGLRVEEYLRYTGLGKGYEWCAAFVSWVYGQAGFSAPRNPWSPALFPKARLILKDQCKSADVFGIYGVKAKRINHVGLVKQLSKDYLISIEGNSNNRVESRRRHLKTIYALSNWVE